MKVLLAVILVGAVSAVPTFSPETPMMSRYRYTSMVGSTLSGPAKEHTGMSFDFTFTVSFFQPNFLLKVERCDVAWMPKMAPVPSYPLCNELVREDSYLYFLYEEGRVIKLYPRVGMSDNIVNIYRAILSSFQVKPYGYSNNRRDEIETDLFGKCPTTITEIRTWNETIIKKIRDLTKCLDAPESTTLPQVEHWNQAKVFTGDYRAEYAMPLFHSNAKYVWPKITRINIGHLIDLSPLSQEAGSLKTYVNPKIVHVEDVPATKGLSMPANTVVTDLRFVHKFPVELVSGCSEKIDFVLRDLPSRAPWEMPILFRRFTEIVNRCPKVELIASLKKYNLCKDFKSIPSDDRFKLTFFLDALRFSWSDTALEVIRDYIKMPNCLDDTQKRDIVATFSLLPVNRIRSCNPLRFAMDIFDATKSKETSIFDEMPVLSVVPLSRSSSLMLGSLIGTYRKTKWYDNCTDIVVDARNKLIRTYFFYFDKIPSNFTRYPLPDQLQPTDTDILSWKWAVDSLMALANTGDPWVLPTIFNAIKAKKLGIEGRLVAIDSLEKFVPVVSEKIRTFLFDIFVDRMMEPEISSAAVPVIVKTYDLEGSVDRIWEFFGSLHTEKRMEVVTFTCSYLNETISSDDPTLLDLGRMFNYFMMTTGVKYICLTSANYGYFSSKAWRGFLTLSDFVSMRSLPARFRLPDAIPRDTLGIGIDSHFYSNFKTRVPSGFTSKLRLLAMGYEIDLAKFGIHGTGLDTMMATLFGPTGYLRNGNKPLIPSGLDSESLKKIFSTKMSLVDWIELFGDKFAWNHFEGDNVLDKLFSWMKLDALRDGWTAGKLNRKLDFNAPVDFYTLVHLAQAWTDGPINMWDTTKNVWSYFTKGDWLVNTDNLNFDFSKNFELLNAQYVIPTAIGLPLKTVAHAAVHVDLKSQTELTYHSDGYFWSENYRDQFKFEGLVNPRLSFSSVLNVTIDDEFLRPTLYLHGNGSFEFNQTGRANLFDDMALTWELDELPDNESEIFKVQYDQYLVIDKMNYSQQIGVDKRNDTQLFIADPDELLGLRMFTSISYANSTDMYPKVWFPFNGPARLSFSIKRMDPQIRQLRFEFNNFTEMNWVTGNVSARWMSIDEYKNPVHEIRLDSTWFTNKINKTFYDITVKGLSLNATVHMFGDQTKWHILEQINGSATTNVSDVTFHADFNRTHLAATILRRRFVEKPRRAIFRVPDYELEVNGSLWNDMFGKVSARLFMDEWELPHWIKMNLMTLGLFVNADIRSSLLKQPVNVGEVLPMPLKSPECHFTGVHYITFDGLKYTAERNGECEYVLARDRHVDDTFAVTVKGRDADFELRVYVNRMMYTLSRSNTHLKITDLQTMKTKFVTFPYVSKEIVAEKIALNNDDIIRLDVGPGINMPTHFSQLKVHFSRNDVLLNVDGFYINRAAGLCGNANYDPKDDFQMTNMTFTTKPTDFVNDWRICEEEPILDTALIDFYECNTYQPNVTIPPTPEIPKFNECHVNEIEMNGYNICSLYFETKFVDLPFVPVSLYYEICRRDVACGKSPYNSVRAYIKVAYKNDVELDSCLYGEYGEWSKCEHSQQKRERPVICNGLKHICGDTVQWRQCNDYSTVWPEQGCKLIKGHIFRSEGQKLCKSRHKLPACITNGETWCTDCTPVYETTASVDQFYCIKSGESQEKFDNVSPLTLVHYKVKDCECTRKPITPKPEPTEPIAARIEQ